LSYAWKKKQSQTVSENFSTSRDTVVYYSGGGIFLLEVMCWVGVVEDSLVLVGGGGG
jgi:hypothetical protein